MATTPATRTNRPRTCAICWTSSTPKASTPRSCVPSHPTTCRTVATLVRTLTWPVTAWSRYSKTASVTPTPTCPGNPRLRLPPSRTTTAAKYMQRKFCMGRAGEELLQAPRDGDEWTQKDGLTKHFPYGIITPYRIQVLIFGACFPAPKVSERRCRDEQKRTPRNIDTQHEGMELHRGCPGNVDAEIAFRVILFSIT